VALELVVPPELGAAASVLSELKARVSAAEQNAKLDRLQRKVPVLGRAAVLAQNWRDNPTTRERRRNLRPQLAARSEWARREAIQRNRAFVAAYREARERWLTNPSATFPPGTYWLRRFANVTVES
jgi:hypothetical protein